MTCGPLIQISPISPTGKRIARVVAASMTSVDGIGRPMDARELPADRVTDCDRRRLGEPITLQDRLAGALCFHSAAIAGWTAMPPPMQTRMWLKSISSKLGVFMSAANIVLTPVNRLNVKLRLMVFDEAFEVARVRNQYVLAALRHDAEAVTLQRKDVI